MVFNEDSEIGSAIFVRFCILKVILQKQKNTTSVRYSDQYLNIHFRTTVF
jgi:hypothetical protein